MTKEEGFEILNDSGDKDYFTIIPNIILNHSNAYDRMVYVGMKRITGERGEFTMSLTNFAKRIGISRKQLGKSIKYLLNRGWISDGGMIKGKTHPYTRYIINDIWKLNSENYKKKIGVQGSRTIQKGERSESIDADDRSPGKRKEEKSKKSKDTKVSSAQVADQVKDNGLQHDAVSLIDYFKKQYAEVISGDEEPIIGNYGRWIKQSKPFVEQLGLKRMKVLVDLYFDKDDKFLKENVWNINCFLTTNMINKLHQTNK